MSGNIETLGYIISNFFRIYVMYLFTNAYFKGQLRFEKKYILSAFLGYLIVNTTGYLLFPNIFVNLATNIIPYFLLTYLYDSFVLRKIIAVTVSYTASLCIDVCMVSIEYISGRKLPIISSGIATSLMIFLAERIFEYCIDKNKVYEELKKKQLLLILSVPVGSLLLAAQTMRERNFNYIIQSVILLGINVVVFYMYDSLLKMSDEKYRLAILEEQNKFYSSQLKIYKEAMEKDKIIKHDIKNHLFKIREYTNSDNIKDLRLYTECMIKSMENQSMLCNTGNRDIDSILNFKCARLQQMGAKLHFDLNIPNIINIESFDLTRILGNLLDNVSDAIGRADKKIVFIRIYFDKGVVNICIRNTYSGQISVNNGVLQTIKEDSENHGLGFKSIKEAIRKYDGEVEYEYTEEVFSVYVILYEK